MASAYRRTFFIHITRDAAGKSARRFVSKQEAGRLKAAGEHIEERPTARTKADAQRIALDLERKAERQRQGLEPMPGDAKMTLGELCDWWLREKCPPGSLVSETSRLRLHVKDHPLGKLALVRVTAVKVEERLREMERDGLGPNSINHLRRVLLGIFRRATKAGLWYGPNPIEAVETRREHERAYATLKPHELPVFLAHVPDQWRDVFATALYLGLRKGELFGVGGAARAVPRARARRVGLRVHVPGAGRRHALEGQRHGAAHPGHLQARRPRRGLRPLVPPLQGKGKPYVERRP